jgi:hypothetical protein
MLIIVPSGPSNRSSADPLTINNRVPDSDIATTIRIQIIPNNSTRGRKPFFIEKSHFKKLQNRDVQKVFWIIFIYFLFSLKFSSHMRHFGFRKNILNKCKSISPLNSKSYIFLINFKLFFFIDISFTALFCFNTVKSLL